MRSLGAILIATFCTSTVASAGDFHGVEQPTVQTAPAPMLPAQPPATPLMPIQPPANVSYLPAGFEIVVTPMDGMTSKGNDVGSTFSIRTVFDTMYNGYIIIPHGTLGQAHIAWRTGKGIFGKSAKMDIAFDWLDLNGRRISLGGIYHQRGQGNTGATVATTVGVGLATLGVGLLVGGAVTGKSAIIQPGVQMAAHTMEALPIALPANMPINAIQAVAQAQLPVQPVNPASSPIAPKAPDADKQGAQPSQVQVHSN